MAYLRRNIIVLCAVPVGFAVVRMMATRPNAQAEALSHDGM
jgi:hypothetical protein